MRDFASTNAVFGERTQKETEGNRRMTNEVNGLIGTWRTDPSDRGALHAFGDNTLDFRLDGTLVLTIHGAVKDEVVFLTYRIVDNEWLETDQPSRPRKERSRFALSDLGLVIEHGEERARYRRTLQQP